MATPQELLCQSISRNVPADVLDALLRGANPLARPAGAQTFTGCPLAEAAKNSQVDNFVTMVEHCRQHNLRPDDNTRRGVERCM
jgi:hypothetical protein